MAKEKFPVTPAIRLLRAEKVPFEGHLYEYVDRGGTKRSAECLGVDEHAVIKTLVFEDDQRQPYLVLMHGDRQVSKGGLARQLKVKSMQPCTREVADKHSGYQVGGTSPFGTRRDMPVLVEASVLKLPRIYVNGGKRGFLVCIDPEDLVRVLKPVRVNVAAT